MFDYRLFYPKISIEDQLRTRRPIQGHEARRVFQLPSDSRLVRALDRR